VEVAGHTDDRGNPTANMLLSQRRADVVRLRLIQLGVPPEQMTARGYGSQAPLVSNSTSAGRAANRRVELRQAQ
jgi:OOP family OmpA-OmpF porin